MLLLLLLYNSIFIYLPSLTSKFFFVVMSTSVSTVFRVTPQQATSLLRPVNHINRIRQTSRCIIILEDPFGDYSFQTVIITGRPWEVSHAINEIKSVLGVPH